MPHMMVEIAKEMSRLAVPTRSTQKSSRNVPFLRFKGEGEMRGYLQVADHKVNGKKYAKMTFTLHPNKKTGELSTAQKKVFKKLTKDFGLVPSEGKKFGTPYHSIDFIHMVDFENMKKDLGVKSIIGAVDLMRKEGRKKFGEIYGLDIEDNKYE